MSKDINKAKIRKNGIIMLAIGVAVAAIAGIASYVSYDTAAPGETYTIYTGPIVLGAFCAIKGLIDLAFPNVFNKNKKVEDKPDEAKAEADIVKEED